MNNAASLELEFLDDNQLAGFRLHQLEILNWGTFHHKVWKLSLNGKTGLLTGDIGSGKSTIVDAITTLLVPAQRIAYNKAAGAENKERSLRSYVLGYYKSERDPQTGIIKPAQLRDQHSYSVILGVFYNQGFDQYITLAQVFYMKEAQGQPARIFIGAEKALSILQDFADFGSEINNLKKRLRQSSAEIFDTFPPYAAWFRRRFGIQNEQALELFHQTVSMKSVGNLTDFVRNHMLEPFAETALRIEHLLLHFDDLNRAYQAVLKAQDQVSLLSPIIADCEQFQQTEQQLAQLHQQLQRLAPYFSELKLQLLTQRASELTQSWQQILSQIEQLEQLREQQQQQLEQLKQAIAQNGGNRLAELEQQIKLKQQVKAERQHKFEQYQKHIEQLGERCVSNSDDFIAQQLRLKQQQQLIQQQIIEQENQEVEAQTDLRELERELTQLTQDLTSLKQRESNIPRTQIEIRQALCGALALNSEKLPFVGELLQVKPDQKDWQGAAERLLHNFALSLIVPDEYYSQVAEWVNHNHLNGRLVYYRVPAQFTSQNYYLHPNSLVEKLAIKMDSPYVDWLENELAKRFDFAACDSNEQFRLEAKAITQQGQIKDKTGRHEKDDRYRLDDRSRYVLGWSNKDKINALLQAVGKLENSATQLQQQIIACKSTRQQLNLQKETLLRLEQFQTFSELDVDTVITEIANLSAEHQALAGSSNILNQLNQKLQQLQQQMQQTKTEFEQLLQTKGGLERDRLNNENELKMTALFVEESPITPEDSAQLEPILVQTLAKRSLTLENCATLEATIRDQFTQQVKQQDKLQNKRRVSIAQAMIAFNHKYALETNEFEASVEGYLDYQNLLDRLNSDDLPRFVAQFKALLNENTINEIANLNAQLNREKETIKQRIGQINRSLESIDYNPERYISLELQNNPDMEIRQFQLDLRACTEGAVTGVEDQQYAETKFLQVKELIDRFRGREGSSEQDKRWTAKVTDVRNWFLFSATERWRADGSSHEAYPDSGGKSGGQKEKLAYTILAASLAYQFGLELGVTRSRTFRFVMIDEAFGRGSDESAQYGLRLFQKMNLQLLIVTPLQKVDIIEPFVASVGLVKNEKGEESRLLNLSIEEHLALKQQQRNER